MKTLKFKTTINCNGCINAVTPFLNAETTIEKWKVDIENPDKILTVEGENVTEQEVMDVVKRAGYAIEKI